MGLNCRPLPTSISFLVSLLGTQFSPGTQSSSTRGHHCPCTPGAGLGVARRWGRRGGPATPARGSSWTCQRSQTDRSAGSGICVTQKTNHLLCVAATCSQPERGRSESPAGSGVWWGEVPSPKMLDQVGAQRWATPAFR
uniref:Secreted protein n=1 Tax=Molossus molossus TaxID=27622 RepID=A0A7J8EE36_MOLMO|nr:hypothetical protein HJG59_008815 [Molossus molossus]